MVEKTDKPGFLGEVTRLQSSTRGCGNPEPVQQTLRKWGPPQAFWAGTQEKRSLMWGAVCVGGLGQPHPPEGAAAWG